MESIKAVAERHHIPFRILIMKQSEGRPKPCGGQTALTKDVKDALVNCLLLCAEFGMPLEKRDLKRVVTMYLNRAGQNISDFSSNIPGDDWIHVISFLKRHEILSNRMCQNIKKIKGRGGCRRDAAVL
ncbi:alanine--tRNA ligase [Plakobranchus ocellatus]|uniref:Alanine--tRNA ligase n=1 Tax=Plakobranchus ocellatus TaxID=259542 RepID=A0AAV4BBC8_9GAST|nr:alanine--tRNA ligase [Plakobranchus ocellatus]